MDGRLGVPQNQFGKCAGEQNFAPIRTQSPTPCMCSPYQVTMPTALFLLPCPGKWDFKPPGIKEVANLLLNNDTANEGMLGQQDCAYATWQLTVKITANIIEHTLYIHSELKVTFQNSLPTHPVSVVDTMLTM
jgi:hypothetical protein